MRIFYAVFVEDAVLEQILNGIRLLCNPQEKHSAHLTVRGPYRQHYQLGAQSQAIRGSQITVNGAGCFWSERQHTVFLRCDSPELHRVWHKPDYPDYNPHITIYDGDSRIFAQKVFDRLSRCNPCFRFPASELQPLVSTKGQNTLDLAASLDVALLEGITDEPFPIGDLPTIDDDQRLRLIGRLCSYLNHHKSPAAIEPRNAEPNPRSSRPELPRRPQPARPTSSAWQLSFT